MIMPRQILYAVVLCSLCMMGLGGEPNSLPALKPTPNDTRLGLTSYLEILLNADKDSSLDEIRNHPSFTSFNPNALKPWMSTSYWVRFRIDHSATGLTHWYLTQDYEHIHQIEVYYPTPDGYAKVTSGTDFPLASREFPLRNLVFKIPIHEETATYYLRVGGMPMMQLRLSWNTVHSVVKNTAMSQLVFGLFFGGLLIIFFFNVILYFAVRNKLHLYYVYYLAATIIALLYENGFSILFDVGRRYDHLFIGAGFLALHGWLLFFRNFFELKKYAGRSNYVLHAIQYVSLVGAFATFTFLPIENSLQVLTGLVFILIPFVLIPAAIRCWQKNIIAGLYLAGWFIFVPLIMISVLTMLSVSIDIFTRYTVQFGTLWESLLFTFALTTQIGSMRASRDEALRDTEENRRLNESTIRVLEAERKSIAREIHDGFNATLITIKVNLETIRRLSKDPAVSDIIEGLIDVVSTRYESARTLVRRLRPEILDTLGLQGAIEELVDSLNLAKTQCTFKCGFEGDTKKLDETTSISLYRIIQEATTNIVKYANASLAEITLAVDDRVSLVISDNGVGFEKGKALDGIGLVSIRERVLALNGECNVHSAPGHGVRLTIQLPVNADASGL